MRFAALHRFIVSTTPWVRQQAVRSASVVATSSSSTTTSGKRVRTIAYHRLHEMYPLDDSPLESSLAYADSVLILSLSLPSRRETCRFHLNLQTATIGQLVDEIKAEDAGVEHVHIHDEHGLALAKSYSIHSLLSCPFTIQLNQQRTFLFDPIKRLQVKEGSSLRQTKTEGPVVEDTVAALYHAFNIMKVYHSKHSELKEEANALSTQLEPLEKVSQQLVMAFVDRTNAPRTNDVLVLLLT